MNAWVALAVVVIAVVVITRWPAVALIPVIVMTVTLPRDAPLPVVAVGQFNVFADDLAALVLILAGALRYRSMIRGLRGRTWSLAILTVVVGASIARGFAEHGVGTTVVDARYVLWLGGAMLFAFSVDWKSPAMRTALLWFCVALGLSLAALGAYNATVYGIGGASSGVYVGSVFYTSRILVAPQALMLGLACLYLLADRTSVYVRLRVAVTCVFLLVFIASQQRTAWVATAIGIGVLAFAALRKRWGTAVLVFAALVWAGVLVLLSGALDSAIDALTQSASDTATIDSRVGSWVQLVSQSYNDGLGTVLFGAPFGDPYWRTEADGRLVSFTPHNFYVSILLRVGLIGLIALLTFVVGNVIRLVRSGSLAQLAMLLAILAFAWGYFPSWLVLPFLGYALASPQEKEMDMDAWLVRAPSGSGAQRARGAN